MQVSNVGENIIKFSVEAPTKGEWTHVSPVSNPPQTVSSLQNCQIVGDVITARLGNKVWIDTAWAGAGSATLVCDRRTPGSDPTIVVATTEGEVYYWTGAAWTLLRKGLSTTAGLWWAQQRYGTDVYITNPYDGIYRFDGTSLLPIGAKLITGANSTTDWTNATADTSDFQEGTASNKVQSGNPGASSVLTYNPSAAIDTSTGRYSARTYLLTKAAGTDCYHFKVKFSAGATATITAATTTFVITDTGGKTLTWAANLWYVDRAKSSTTPLNTNNWVDAYCFPADATESATFNPAIVDKLEWKVTTSAGQTFMLIDDVYSIYQTTMPAVRYLAEWRNILFGANTTANPDALYWSKSVAPDEFTTTATQPIKAGGDGITGLAPFFHQLTIGTDHHVHTLSGSIVGQTYPVYLFDVNEVTDEMGCSSHRSMVKADNILYWWYLDNLVAYDGTSVRKISYPIDVTIGDVDKANLQMIVGARHRTTNEVWWTWRRSGQSVNDRLLRWNFVYGALLTGTHATPILWQTFSSGVETLISPYNTDRKIYRENDTNYTTYGVAIDYIIELPAMGVAEQSLEWADAQFAYLSNTGSLTVYYRLADHLRALTGTSYTSIQTVDQAATNEYGRIRFGYPGKVMQVKITASGIKFQLQFPFVVRSRSIGDDRTFP